MLRKHKSCNINAAFAKKREKVAIAVKNAKNAFAIFTKA